MMMMMMGNAMMMMEVRIRCGLNACGVTRPVDQHRQQGECHDALYGAVSWLLLLLSLSAAAALLHGQRHDHGDGDEVVLVDLLGLVDTGHSPLQY